MCEALHMCGGWQTCRGRTWICSVPIIVQFTIYYQSMLPTVIHAEWVSGMAQMNVKRLRVGTKCKHIYRPLRFSLPHLWHNCSGGYFRIHHPFPSSASLLHHLNMYWVHHDSRFIWQSCPSIANCPALAPRNAHCAAPRQSALDDNKRCTLTVVAQRRQTHRRVSRSNKVRWDHGRSLEVSAQKDSARKEDAK